MDENYLRTLTFDLRTGVRTKRSLSSWIIKVIETNYQKG